MVEKHGAIVDDSDIDGKRDETGEALVRSATYIGSRLGPCRQ